jgi:uncharacterized protein (DUF1697 family)
MIVQIALLRGINVGSNKRVRMSDLRAVVEGIGYSSVRTLLNSGNVVFATPKGSPEEAAWRIEEALRTTLGVSARVIALNAEELSEAIEANPLVKIANNSSRLLLGIMARPRDRAKLSEIAQQDWGEERIELASKGKRAVYMWMPKGVIESKLNAAVSKALGDGVTARSWATMLKLKEMSNM